MKVELNKDTLKHFLESKNEQLSIYLTEVRYIEKLVQELDPSFNMQLEGEETNGWQIDFWYKYNCNGQKFTYSGSLHYGNCKLTKGDEDE